MRVPLTSGTNAARSVVVNGTLRGTCTQDQMRGAGVNTETRQGSLSTPKAVLFIPHPYPHQLHTHLYKHSCSFLWPVITERLLHARLTLSAFVNFTFTTAQRCGHCDYSHFTDTEPEAPVQARKLLSGGTRI